MNPAEFPSICAWMCASGRSKLHAGAQPEHAPFFPIPCCSKVLECTGWMGAPHHSSRPHACPLRLAQPNNLNTTTMAHREGDRDGICNTVPKGIVLKYQLQAGVQRWRWEQEQGMIPWMAVYVLQTAGSGNGVYLSDEELGEMPTHQLYLMKVGTEQLERGRAKSHS